jgi:hypothetical protein
VGALGSDAFAGRLREQAGPALRTASRAPEARRLAGWDPELVFRVVADDYEREEGAFGRRYDRHLSRSVAAWLCRRHTGASLRAFAERLGLK